MIEYPFYENFVNKRVDKIINIFGKDWFANKSILELGACQGDVGIHFMKLGADVLFSDVREENLKAIFDKINFKPDTKIINQNLEYDLKCKFDLVLHMGVLYHIENWKKDLKSALNHSQLMILESKVNPVPNSRDSFYDAEDFKYDGYQCRQPIFTQESVENTLSNLGCRFIRFDNSELNCNWGWVDKNQKIRHVYDWNYDNYQSIKREDGPNRTTWFKRFWLVLK